jgi:hypothetical protein
LPHGGTINPIRLIAKPVLFRGKSAGGENSGSGYWYGLKLIIFVLEPKLRDLSAFDDKNTNNRLHNVANRVRPHALKSSRQFYSIFRCYCQ